jgi:PD-(D/E)XK endonuclease
MLTTDQKGAIAELAIAHKAASLGIGVSKPLTDGERYDLVFDLRPMMIRVQCKWTACVGDVLVVRCRSCRRTRAGLLHRYYTDEEIDAVAAYCGDLERCLFVPLDQFSGRGDLQLRVAPARNNQRLGINWADDFDFEARLTGLLGP